MSQLVQLQKAYVLLEQAKTVDDIRQVRDMAEAVRHYAKVSSQGLDVINEASRVKLLAERKGGQLLKEMRDQGQLRVRGGDQHAKSHDGTLLSLSDLGLSKNQSSRWQRLDDLEPAVIEDYFVAQMDAGREITQSDLLRLWQQLQQHVPVKTPPLPDGTYSVLLCDPPWQYEHVKTRSRSIERRYATMETADICALPIAELAADDAVLFLWATAPKLDEAMQVMRAWGFSYRTNMCWDKMIDGMGFYWRQRHELLLLGTCGTPGTPAPDVRPSSVLRIRRKEHSVKPDEVYDMIEALYPDRTRIELFARTAREGWDAWGAEAPTEAVQHG